MLLSKTLLILRVTSRTLCLQDWKDERLQWDEREIPLKDVVIEARHLWRPEFAAINGCVVPVQIRVDPYVLGSQRSVN